MQIKKENFEEIYNETYNTVLRFIVVKCNDIDNINDILQDTYIEFLKILRKKRFLEINNIKNYMIAITNNIIKRHYYKKKKDNVVIYCESDEDIEDNIDLEEDFITKENAKNVWEYIKNKDLVTAKIFYLYFALELKISEIAEGLSLNESTVKNRIYRTLKEIKENLGKEVSDDE